MNWTGVYSAGNAISEDNWAIYEYQADISGFVANGGQRYWLSIHNHLPYVRNAFFWGFGTRPDGNGQLSNRLDSSAGGSNDQLLCFENDDQAEISSCRIPSWRVRSSPAAISKRDIRISK